MVADSSESSVDSFARNRIEGGERNGAILASLAYPAVCFAGALLFRLLLQQVFRELCAACDAELRVCHR